MASMIKIPLVKTLAIAGLIGAPFIAAAYAQSQPPSRHQFAMKTDKLLKIYPAPKAGMKRFVINLPGQANENDFRVAITPGKEMMTDGVNHMRLGGTLKKHTVSGWGYDYYRLEGQPENIMSTLMAPMPGTPKVQKFVTSGETLIRYNSRLPVVVYVKDDLEVRYRIFNAGPSRKAELLQEPNKAGEGTAPGSRDPYIGKTEARASAAAANAGVPFRVVERDGQPQMVTFDYRPGRINAAVNRGRVVSYEIE